MLGEEGAEEVMPVRIGLVGLLYLVIGIVVAASQNYFSGIDRAGDILEAVIAVLIWPVLLFGVDIDIGGGPRVT